MAKVFGIEVEEEIASREALRRHHNPPSRFVSNKVVDRIDPLAARFLDRVGLAFLATRRPDGGIDLSPRGDPPGFIRVLDEKTIALPDRPGNNRVDAFENLLQCPEVGLICVIPGHRDTLRIGGTARIVNDSALAREMAVDGKPARLILLIRVERLLCHCAKAFKRAHAWSPEHWPDTAGVPSLAEMMIAHGELAENTAEMAAIIRSDEETRLY